MRHTVLLLLLHSLLCYHVTHQNELDDAQQEDILNPDCPAGEVVQNDMCVVCSEGFYADNSIQQCLPCPLDTYSDQDKNTECKPCPGRFQTIYDGTRSAHLCVDVCHIPETVNSWYEFQVNGVVLDQGERVRAGEQIVLRCKDDDHNVLKTEYSFLIITCTATFHNTPLPNTCYSARESETVATNGLICYDSCFKETSDGRSRFVQSVGGGTQVVDSCPINECRGDEDICATVSYTDTFQGVTRVHFTCEKSSAFDAELCSGSGATNAEVNSCKVERCNTDKCNDPSAVGGAAQHAASSVVMVIGVMLWHVTHT